MAIKKISNQEVKGTKDWFPEEFSVRNYIFSKWREVCLSYGFSEYLSPLLESADVYRAKSGEDVGGKELMIFIDQGGRELAIRPEMTPSVVRMVSKIYQTSPKPLKLFSITNFIRNEKPQRGRNREFWQLNCDTFGGNSILSDVEILLLSVDLMLAFNPPKNSFTVKVSHRGLVDALLDSIKIKKDKKLSVVRLMDKKNKLSSNDFIEKLEDLGLKNDQIDRIIKFVSAKNLDDLANKIPEISDSYAFVFIKNVLKKIKSVSYDKYVIFSPDIIRGFDYYDGLVFEIFDNHPDNNRAMFGGGRYNGLASVFGVNDFPAIGFAPGDETFKLFLESWKILPKNNFNNNFHFLPLLDESLENESLSLAKKLRSEGKRVDLGLGVMKVGKALEYANKNNISQVVIFAKDEFEKGGYKIRNMDSGEEVFYKI